jgi:RNA polymerase sigma-70 factor (family 1)
MEHPHSDGDQPKELQYRILFEKVFNEHYKSLKIFAFKVVGNWAVAEDTVVNTFVKLWKLMANFSTTEAIRAFLFVTTRNACLDYLRHKNVEAKANRELLFTKETEESFHVKEEAIQYEAARLQAIKNEVEKLPEQQRLAFTKSMEGLTNTEIARQLDCAEKTVMNNRTLAIKQIRSALKAGIVLYFICYVIG